MPVSTDLNRPGQENAASPDPKVTIVTLNWHTSDETIDCLDSLRNVDYGNFEIVIVDNGSTDNSLAAIRAFLTRQKAVCSGTTKFGWKDGWLPMETYLLPASSEGPSLPVVLIAANKNYGFPGGNNIGITLAKEAHSEYVVLLNNDTVVDPVFLRSLVAVASADDRIGIAGSKVYYYDDPQLIQTAGGDIHWLTGRFENYGDQIDRGQWDAVVERDVVYANGMLVRASLLERLGGLDEFFVFGIEEYDLCVRAKKAGFRTVYAPTARIWHKGGRSAAKLVNHPETLAMLMRNRGLLGFTYEVTFFKKHLGYPLAVVPIAFRTTSILLGLFRNVAFIVIRKKPSKSPMENGGVGRLRRLEAEQLIRRFLGRK
jgi:GT2 family glycosyltransferase